MVEQENEKKCEYCPNKAIFLDNMNGHYVCEECSADYDDMHMFELNMIEEDD
jgi:DNA-directed RNA polymerase subunit RPC12/RpoP